MKTKMVFVTSVAMLCLSVTPIANADQCWKTVVQGGTKSGDGAADLYTHNYANIDVDKTKSILSAKSACRLFEDTNPAQNICGTPDSYPVTCGPTAETATSPNPMRAFVEKSIRDLANVLVVGSGFNPQAVIVKVIVDNGVVVVLDAYDKDRGDVKEFLSKVGKEINPGKLDEWLKNPANSLERSDIGKAGKQAEKEVQNAKENWNRSDLGKLIKF